MNPPTEQPAVPRQVNIYEAKSHFSRLVEEVEAGAEILIARNGRPVARLVPLKQPLHDRVPESRTPTPMLRLPELPADQRPTTRLFRLGAAALTDAELVAILLTTGTRHHDVLTHAQQLLHQIGGIAGLTRRHPEHLIKIDGLSTTKAARLLAALALPARAHDTQATTIRGPDGPHTRPTTII
jgi:prevent-host-death family protein